MFIDTHCHLNDEKFDNIDVIYQNLIKNGLFATINMGCDLESSFEGLSLSERYDKIYFGVGFHPSDVDKFTVNCVDDLIMYSRHDKCLAIGEIGLDYHYDGTVREKQKEIFVTQLELAKSLKLPVSIHSRDATEDMIKILKENKSLLEYGAVMHCFSGSLETAKILLNLGLMISFSGTLTFKNAKNLVEVAKYVPMDFCLTETDSPYLAPEPFRGKINEPKNVQFVLKKIAELKGMGDKEVSKIVLDNAKRIFYKIKNKADF